MNLKGTRLRYGLVAIALHWISAAAIIVALPFGLLAAHAPDTEDAERLLRIHVTFGFMFVVLTMVRAVWWLVDTRPAFVEGGARWQAGATHVVHVLFYVVPIILGLSGIAVVILSGAVHILFGTASGMLPRFWALSPMTVHALSAFTLIGLLGLHIVAALYHQYYRRDHLLARMGVGAMRDSGR